MDRKDTSRKYCNKGVEEPEDVHDRKGKGCGSDDDKIQAWKNLIIFRGDGESSIKPDAVKCLLSVFLQARDKQKAWENLVKLADDENSSVQWRVIHVLSFVFPQVPDKQRASHGLLELLNSEKRTVRRYAVQATGFVFSQLPDRQLFWNKLKELTVDEDIFVRKRAARELTQTYRYIPYKEKTWDDFFELLEDTDHDIRMCTYHALKSAIPYAPDRQKAWEDVVKLAEKLDSRFRGLAVEALCSVFPIIQNKKTAWQDLLKLASKGFIDLQKRAVEALIILYQFVPDRWEEEENSNGYVKGFGYRKGCMMYPFEEEKYRGVLMTRLLDYELMSYYPAKSEAWEDLIALAKAPEKRPLSYRLRREHRNVRALLIYGLSSAMIHHPVKEKAWDDMIKLEKNAHLYEKKLVKNSLANSYRYLPDRQRAWDYLVKTAEKGHISIDLSVIFPFVPGKEEALNDLFRLAENSKFGLDREVNCSLGKVFLQKATRAETEKEYREELEKAIQYFEKAGTFQKVDPKFRTAMPPRFCHIFFQSFHSIIFHEGNETEDEPGTYLNEMENRMEYRKNRVRNKNYYYSAVGKLANVLGEVQSKKDMQLETMKSELKFCRKYCEEVSELINLENLTPQEERLLQKQLPKLDRNSMNILQKIQEEAGISSKKSRGPVTMKLSPRLSEECKKWDMGNIKDMEMSLEKLIYIIESALEKKPKNKEVFTKISQLRKQRGMQEKFGIMCDIISLIPELETGLEHTNIE